MYFHIRCIDKPNSMDLRMATRADHLDYLKGFAGNLYLAGPTLAEDGKTVTGSVIIIDVDDKAAAEAFCAGDPYAKAGLFQSVTVDAFNKTLPAD
jgi:hypothetical protein